MTCEHWKRCGDCHSPALVEGLRAEEDRQVARAERAERERDELEARVRELEAALRAIVAIDSASPEHRIAMRALYAHCPSCSRHTRWERVDESDIIAAGRRGDS